MEGMMDDPSIVKGKRTKRQRLHLPSPPTTAAAAASSSSSTSAELSDSTTEEEEDMANCLILLAQGAQKPDPTTKLTSRRFAEAATTTSGKAGFFVYECKTCGKCFPSFQALGGHRASHKKPKLSIPPATASSPADESEAKQVVMGEDSIQLTMNSFALQAAGKSRTHECSICGAEFSSGQALGGHMRRHRQVSLQEPGKKEGLSLDLNLPAPPEDDGGDLVLNSASPVSAAKTPPFSFASKTPILLFDVCAS